MPPAPSFRPHESLSSDPVIPSSRFWPVQSVPRHEDVQLRQSGNFFYEQSRQEVPVEAVNVCVGLERSVHTAAPIAHGWTPGHKAIASTAPLGQAVPRASLPRPGGHRPGRGNTRQLAVWCHERSHKSDAAQTRERLQTVLARHDLELVCQKTSCKFKAWQDDVKTSLCMLVTDWRQLKPCMDIFEEEPRRQPDVVVLLCEQNKIFLKACAWNESRSAAPFPVHVLTTEDANWTHKLEQVCLQLQLSRAEPSAEGSRVMEPGLEVWRPSATMAFSSGSAEDFTFDEDIRSAIRLRL
mmetsp:Transcript_39518/g.91356  ORF Transcript_39518/g.91356 Transcript_39518/m.91356 type:complete len:296 (+) Transcript_39518:110-997(+)